MTDAGTPRSFELIIRGRAIREDGLGRVCLDDLWEISGAKETRAPKQWKRGRAATDLINALQLKVTNSHLKNGTANRQVIEAGRGQGVKGTYAHPIVAAAYAGYLSPKLEIEIREVWLRYRTGDATLADEVLQKASVEANHWAGVRALARARRNSYTDTLKAHGVEGKGYMHCTEAVYLNLLGGRSYELRNEMQIAPKTNLRDHLPADKLAFIMAAEALSAERIAEEDRSGNAACAEASGISASAIKDAIDADRRARQRPLI